MRKSSASKAPSAVLASLVAVLFASAAPSVQACTWNGVTLACDVPSNPPLLPIHS
jgi:hypothetical protein